MLFAWAPGALLEGGVAFGGPTRTGRHAKPVTSTGVRAGRILSQGLCPLYRQESTSPHPDFRCHLPPRCSPPPGRPLLRARTNRYARDRPGDRHAPAHRAAAARSWRSRARDLPGPRYTDRASLRPRLGPRYPYYAWHPNTRTPGLLPPGDP